MINKVYLSGEITGRIEDIAQEGLPRHVVFDLCVPHVTRGGVEKREQYRINAWNRNAMVALETLAPGMLVALQGYLTQRTVYVGDRAFIATEVSMNEVTAPQLPEPALSREARRDIEAIFAEM